jgi:hypothetical protein
MIIYLFSKLYPVLTYILQAVNSYHAKKEMEKMKDAMPTAASTTPTKVTKRNMNKKQLSESSTPLPSPPPPTTTTTTPVVPAVFSEKDMASNASAIVEQYRGVRLAKSRPKLYLRLVSYMMVLTELATLLVPMVAIGAQWMTALCRDTPTVTAIFSLTYWSVWCMVGGEADMCDNMLHSCIMASSPSSD